MPKAKTARDFESGHFLHQITGLQRLAETLIQMKLLLLTKETTTNLGLASQNIPVTHSEEPLMNHGAKPVVILKD